MRGGPLAYVVVGALASPLLGVAVLAVTDNQISDSKAEIAKLEERKGGGRSRAPRRSRLHPVPRRLHEQRVATVTSLADSRFDWERVMRELSLVLPGDVWLTNLSGTVRARRPPSDGDAGVALRSSDPRPGAGNGRLREQPERRRRLRQALKDIDGVTRVGLESSELAGRRRRIGLQCCRAPAKLATSSPSSRWSSPSTPHRCRRRRPKPKPPRRPRKRMRR